ncbi:MAG: hypothetical protein KTR30_14945 [Saprospiraceae bacterium]|nr:hypothetical protein [Saprospiraceae bacterium]
MKISYWLSFLLFLPSILPAQASYTSMTEKALSMMWEADDSAGYRQSLALYEAAFARFPDSIDHLGLYKASVLAGELMELDKAFAYLRPVYEVEEDEYGTPGWAYVVGEYSTAEYKNLLADPRWDALQAKALERKRTFYQQLEQQKKEFLTRTDFITKENERPKILYKKLKTYNPYIAKAKQSYSISLPVKDTALTSYFIHLPSSYDPNKKYPMLIFLHGAVRYNEFADYQAKSVLSGWNRFYTELAARDEVILVFPSGSKQYNWMIPDDGFFLIPTIIKQIKSSINIDDNKVFVSGHSNGATGSFSYLMKQPTQFAGFYGFNTYPKVFTGGTFIENVLNRSFINFSTDEDYYYPPGANDTLNAIMESISAVYEDHRFNGFPHWFPAFDESKPAHETLFSDLERRTRNPFPEEISWEFDDEQYGAVDWLSEMKLDTLMNKAEWHRPLNFKIDQWLDYNDQDSLIVKKVDKEAFDFPRKSGKVQARYRDNTFYIETSMIKSLRVNISPEMVNLKRNVRVVLNGELQFDQKIKYDQTFMLKSFEKHLDRAQIWVNAIQLQL